MLRITVLAFLSRKTNRTIIVTPPISTFTHMYRHTIEKSQIFTIILSPTIIYFILYPFRDKKPNL